MKKLVVLLTGLLMLACGMAGVDVAAAEDERHRRLEAAQVDGDLEADKAPAAEDDQRHMGEHLGLVGRG